LDYASIEATARLLGLAAARTVPLTLSLPVLGGPALPMQLRLALGLGLAALCLPSLAVAPEAAGALGWGLLAAREVLVGVVMGFAVACVFRGAEAAGELTDVLRGGDLGSMPSPAGEGETRPLGALMLLLAAVVFLEIGGVGQVASALARSYEAIPLGVPMPGEFPRTAVVVAVIASGKLIEAAIGLAAPAVVALVLADVVFGMLGRAVPRLPFTLGRAPVKALLGLAVVLVGLGGTDLALQSGFRGLLGLLGGAFHLRP
jgi:flagellar biosynthetic protein FliR